MAISGILAVTSLRFTSFINIDAANDYLTSLISTFQEMVGFSNLIGVALLLAFAVGLALRSKHDHLIWITTVTGLAGLFIVGSWLTLILNSSLSDNSQSPWLLVLSVINLLFSTLFLGLPLSLIGLFIYNALRPE